MNRTKLENMCLQRPDAGFLLKMRQSVSSESLKKVSIRFDFTGASNLEAWISFIKKEFCADVFSDYSFGRFSYPFSIMNGMSELSELLNIPEKDLARLQMHVFSKGNIEGFDDNLTLYISIVSLELQIDCCNYRSIDSYLEFMISLMNSLLEEDAFVTVRRFSIRKTDGFMYKSWEEVVEYLESQLFFNETIKLPVGYESNYIDRFVCKAFDVKVNNNRLFRVAKRGIADIYQAILDIEAYADNTIRDLKTDNLNALAMDLNDCLFNMFLNSVTSKYISDHAKS